MPEKYALADNNERREVVSRQEALAKGLKWYFTGKPCKNGHVAARHTVHRTCYGCSRARAEKHYEENREEYLEYKRNYYQENKEFFNQLSRENYYENKEYYSEIQKAYYYEHKDYFAQRQKEYVQENQSYFNAIARERRAIKLQAKPDWSEDYLIKEFYKSCPEGYDVDHIVPLKSEVVCGLHCLDNLQYLPRLDNRSKGNRLLPEHSSYKGAPAKNSFKECV